MTKTILDEIRLLRDEHAKQFNYDLAAIAADHRRFAAELQKKGVKFSKPSRPRVHTRLAAGHTS